MEWISWVATVAAATISLLAMGVAIWQGGIASRSATAASIQAEQAKRSADAAADQARYAKQAAEAADKAAAQDHIAEIQQTQRDFITVKNGLYALVDAALEPAAFVRGVQSGTVDVIKSLKFTTLTVNADFDADMHAAASEAGQLLHDMAQAALGESNVTADGEDIAGRLGEVVATITLLQRRLEIELKTSRAKVYG